MLVLHFLHGSLAMVSLLCGQTHCHIYVYGFSGSFSTITSFWREHLAKVVVGGCELSVYIYCVIGNGVSKAVIFTIMWLMIKIS